MVRHKKIYLTDEMQEAGESLWCEDHISEADTEYIRADIVERLKPHLRHLPGCEIVKQPFKLPFAYCNCGLTDLLKELR